MTKHEVRFNPAHFAAGTAYAHGSRKLVDVERQTIFQDIGNGPSGPRWLRAELVRADGQVRVEALAIVSDPRQNGGFRHAVPLNALKAALVEDDTAPPPTAPAPHQVGATVKAFVGEQSSALASARGAKGQPK